MKVLAPAERLIVAADFKPTNEGGRRSVRYQVLSLADNLSDTGIYLKVNSALRACGYDLIDEIHSRGLRVFADLKLFDISETLSTDGALLKEAKPELLTTVSLVGVAGMQALKLALPSTELLAVTLLTSLKDPDAQAMFTCDSEDAVMRLAALAAQAKVDGLISAAKEVAALRGKFGQLFTLNSPAIRPLWSLVEGDDQDPTRVMTPTKAIRAGADRIVVGRPVIRPPSGSTRREAALRIVDEIAAAA